MFFEKIEQMKRDYTDKFVLVDGSRPELARFRDVVGRVKTINMNGRALVEFDDYHLNVGWFDIAPEFLKVVDQPPPKPAKSEAKKAAPKAAPAKGEAAGASSTSAAGKAKPTPNAKAGGKPSVADMLAAARAGGAAKPAGSVPAKKGESASAGASSAKPSAPKVDRSKMSVAEMIAAAKAGGAAGSAPAAPQAKAAPPAPAEESEQEQAPAPAPAAAKPKSSGERVDKSKMTIDDMVTWCREHDTK